MDGSTDRCPQCGAAIRPSARYCVTCGVKLPESAAATYPAAASGWAAREEHAEAANPNPASTSAWAMPAAHPEDEQSDSVEPQAPEAAATSTSSADEELPESDEAVSQPVSGQSWDAAATELEVEPANASPILSEDRDMNGLANEVAATVAVNDAAEIDAAVLESGTPIADEEEETHGDHSESAVLEPDIESVVIEESADPIASGDAVLDDSDVALSNEELAIAADPSTEQPKGANPSPLEEAAFEEMLPYAAEAGSKWEPSAEPDEIFALDEIAFDDSSDFEAKALVVANDSQPVDGAASTVENGTEAMQRANQLIDELRGLLPALTAPHQTIQSPDYVSLRERALAARGDVSFDQFAALREVVQEALSRPRDVEVVLRLSQRVEDMNALLGERDRLQQAFEQVIAQLDASGAS